MKKDFKLLISGLFLLLLILIGVIYLFLTENKENFINEEKSPEVKVQFNEIGSSNYLINSFGFFQDNIVYILFDENKSIVKDIKGNVLFEDAQQIYSIENIDENLVFLFTKNSKENIYFNGEIINVIGNYVDGITVNNGLLSYISYNNSSYILVEQGNVKELDFDVVFNLKYLNEKLSFQIEDETKDLIYFDGKIKGENFEFISYLGGFLFDNEFSFIAFDQNSSYLVKGEEVFNLKYDIYSHIEIYNNDLFYVSMIDDKQFITNYAGINKTNLFSQILNFRYYNDNLYYIASKDEITWDLYENNKKLTSGYDFINDFLKVGDELAYLYLSNNQTYLSYKNEEIKINCSEYSQLENYKDKLVVICAEEFGNKLLIEK